MPVINPNVRILGPFGEKLRYALRQHSLAGYLKSRVLWNWYPRLKLASRFPGHVDIETCSLCQMHCPMCFQTVRDDVRTGIMDPALFRRIMAEVARERPCSIRLSWRGECLLHPEFPDLLRHARQVYSGNISFLTNGLRLDESLLENLVDTRTDYIVISADGVGATYEAVRRPGNFSDLQDKLRTLQEIKRRRGSQWPAVRINAVSLWFREGEQEEFQRVFSPLADRILVGSTLNNFAAYPVPHDPARFCASPWQRLLVRHDGSVHPCCDDYLGLYPLGDATTDSLRDIWRGKRLAALRMAIAAGRRLDTGLCRAMDCGVDQNPTEQDPAFRSLLRAQVVKDRGPDSPLLRYLEP